VEIDVCVVEPVVPVEVKVSVVLVTVVLEVSVVEAAVVDIDVPLVLDNVVLLVMVVPVV
jgi:hypothetical protein